MAQSINELKSYTEYNVSTPTSVFTIGFQYEHNVDHVNVYVDGVEATAAGYTIQHDSQGTVTLTPAVPSGVVRLVRETDIDTSAHTFSAGAKFTAGNMDENFEQVRHAQQEVRDNFFKLKDDIGFTNLEQTIQAVNNVATAVNTTATQVQQDKDTAVAAASAAADAAASAAAANTAAQQVLVDVSTATSDVYAALETQQTSINNALTAQQTAVNNSLTAIAGGHKAYTTLALAQAAQASLPANTIVEVTNDPTSSNNGTYQWNGTTLTKSAYDPLAQAKTYTDTELKGVAVSRQIAFENCKEFLKVGRNFKDLTLAEQRVFDFIKDFKIYGNSDKDFSFVIIHSGGVLTTLQIDDGFQIINLHNEYSDLSIISDNGSQRRVRFNHFSPTHGYVSFGEVEYDYSAKTYESFTYNVSANNPNLVFRAKQKIKNISQKGIFNLEPDAEGFLLKSSTYMELVVSEPFILGSVSVNVVRNPTEQPAWVECTIYPQDNGLGTAQRISSTDQVPFYGVGELRMPLENKVMQAGKYIIGFKTNVPECLATKNGQFWRDYDAQNRPMPLNAPILSGADKYAFFPAFALYKHESVLQPKLGAKWHLEYHPEFNFMGGNDDLLFYIHMSGLSGSRDIWFGMSTDGGKTINKIGLNANESTDLPLIVDAMHGVSRFVGDIFEMYVARGSGKITKVVINAGQAPVITDITPYSNVSTNDLHSYAPLVIWKGFLWWGEYGNPEAPKIHKMDLDTGSWYVSIEKPTSGATGARHVHFLYPSPYDANVLWSNWGDATNGGGQGVNKLTITGSKAGTSLDAWVQFSTSRHDDVGTTLPYPTAIMELYEPANGKLGSNEVVMIGAGDQPPVHLTVMQTKAELAGKALFKPLNFKRESSPNTETVHWLAMDEDKTIYYMTVESNPHMSIYASPHPYTETFQISKYWQQALAGKMHYSKGFLHTKNHRFPKVKFVNALDAVDDQISKVPYIANANESNIITQFNKLIENLQGAGILQTVYEQGNDKNQSFFVDEAGKWENWG